MFDRYFKRARRSGARVGIAGVDLPRNRRGPRAARRGPAGGGGARDSRRPARRAAWLVLLDERGAALTSAQWADEIGKARDGGAPAYALVIGGPDGLDPALRERGPLASSRSAR